MRTHHIGQRLSTKDERCTVRYVGPVRGKTGEWLGVEWDNPDRGKHSGTFEGDEYFKCRNPSRLPGSFIRPTLSFDWTRTFLEALHEKYAPGDRNVAENTQRGHAGLTQDTGLVWISGKQVEEVGYDKIDKEQAQLDKLSIVILDKMYLTTTAESSNSLTMGLPNILPNVVDLDLGRNLLEDLGHVLAICAGLPKLQSLTLDGNRLHDLNSSTIDLPHVRTLSLNAMTLQPEEIHMVLLRFSGVQTLSLSENMLPTGLSVGFHLPSTLQHLVLESNAFQTLDDVAAWTSECQCLQSLALKNNSISQITQSTAKTNQLSGNLTRMDLANNNISSWSFVDALSSFAPSLKDLRMTQNPLYEISTSPSGKLLRPLEVSMLIMARLPLLQTLNYSPVTEKERLSAEKFYLSLIAEELGLVRPEDEHRIIAQHPRYRVLCEEYGVPQITRESAKQIDPNSLEARLVRCNFHFGNLAPDLKRQPIPSSFTLKLPKSLSVYGVLGMIGKRFGLIPLKIRLIWETGEQDPVGNSFTERKGVQEWDSEDEDGADEVVEWAAREVELVAGTRPLGTIIDKADADIRIEVGGRRALVSEVDAWKGAL